MILIHTFGFKKKYIQYLLYLKYKDPKSQEWVLNCDSGGWQN